MVLENRKNKDKTTQKNKTENITIGAKKITNFKKITQSKKKKKKNWNKKLTDQTVYRDNQK